MYYELYLPFPPTVNNYYVKSSHGGRHISHKGRLFRDQVIKCVHEQLPGTHITERMLLEIVLFPPDSRIRDMDNYNKGLLDAITHSGLWSDDHCADQIFNYRGETRRNDGSVYVRISDAGPVIRNICDLPDS